MLDREQSRLARTSGPRNAEKQRPFRRRAEEKREGRLFFGLINAGLMDCREAAADRCVGLTVRECRSSSTIPPATDDRPQYSKTFRSPISAAHCFDP
jgi:hypothetical protein